MEKGTFVGLIMCQHFIKEYDDMALLRTHMQWLLHQNGFVPLSSVANGWYVCTINGGVTRFKCINFNQF